MKRFHIHISVSDLDAAKQFYSTLFDMKPSVDKPDYAKWMVDDPRINLAVSKSMTSRKGVNHLGIQVSSEEELSELERRLANADVASMPEENAKCCYARSDKHWTRDPDNVVWELFNTLEGIPVYGADFKPDINENTPEKPKVRNCC